MCSYFLHQLKLILNSILILRKGFLSRNQLPHNHTKRIHIRFLSKVFSAHDFRREPIRIQCTARRVREARRTRKEEELSALTFSLKLFNTFLPITFPLPFFFFPFITYCCPLTSGASIRASPKSVTTHHNESRWRHHDESKCKSENFPFRFFYLLR